MHVPEAQGIVEFSVLTEPDLDDRNETIPEASEPELNRLRERIDDLVVSMQEGESCPLMRTLTRRQGEPTSVARGAQNREN